MGIDLHVTEAYIIPEGATVEEAIRIVCDRQRGHAPDLHAPGRAMDIVTTPAEARAVAASFLAGHTLRNWVRGDAGGHESHFDAIDRLTSPSHVVYSDADDVPYDLDPDRCWRCDARGAENDLGTCDACRDDLRG